MMFNKCSNFHYCILRSFNLIETVYELFDNPVRVYSFGFHPVQTCIQFQVIDFVICPFEFHANLYIFSLYSFYEEIKPS